MFTSCRKLRSMTAIEHDAVKRQDNMNEQEKGEKEEDLSKSNNAIVR